MPTQYKDVRGARITEMYAFIVLEEETDSEAIPAFSGPHPDGSTNEIFMPMVGADYDRIMALVPLAREMMAKIGKPMRLVKFTKMEEVSEVKPL